MPSQSVTIRLNLSGRQQTSQGLTQIRNNIIQIGDAQKKAQKSTQSFLGQFLKYGLAYAAIHKVVGGVESLITGTVALGVKTASTNQQAQVAFTNMLGSAQAATDYIGQMQKFAAHTPFEFTDVETGAQRLMAMGVNAKDVLPYLTSIGDAVSGIGGGKEGIDRVVTAIGQMTAKGKIQSDEILQLTEAGIPALKILAAQYGVTTSKMQAAITAGVVSSDKAVPLLIAGLEHGTKATQSFGGMMDAQSHTIAGAWSNIVDNTSQGLASLVAPWEPAIASIENTLAGSLDPKGSLFSDLRAFSAGAANRAPALIARITTAIGQIGPTMRRAKRDAEDMFLPFEAGFLSATGGRGMSLVIADVRALGRAFLGAGPQAAALRRDAHSLGVILGFVADNIQGNTWAVKPAIGAFLTYKAVINGARKASELYASVTKGVTAVTRAVSIATGIYVGITRAQIIVDQLAAFATYKRAVAWGAMTAAERTAVITMKIVTAAQWAWNAALDANPVGLIILGVTALAGLGYELYKHWGPFHSLVNDIWKWLKDAAVWTGKVLGIGGSGTDDKQKKKHVVASAGGVPIVAGARAAGGNVNANSTYRVNEDGVETFIPSVPGRILPATAGGDGAGNGALSGMSAPIQVSFTVDGKVLARGVIAGGKALAARL